MLILLSPAKSLDFESKFYCKNHTIPHFKAEIAKLINQLKTLSIADLEKLMTISKKLAELNFERFNSFQNDFNLKNSRQAILAFDGDVYAEIEKEKYDEKDFDFAQKHVRILSGLYGILKPLDLIQPYRLEMGTDFKKTKLEKNLAKNLYQFWGDKISEYLNKEAKNCDIINLASEEYFGAIDSKLINAKIINVVFKEKKSGAYKIVGINAKKARGMMTNFIVKNKIVNVEEIKKFKEADYKFSKELSDEANFVFTR